MVYIRLEDILQFSKKERSAAGLPTEAAAAHARSLSSDSE